MRSQKLFSQNVLLFSVSHEKTLHIFCMPYDLNVLSKFELKVSDLHAPYYRQKNRKSLLSIF